MRKGANVSIAVHLLAGTCGTAASVAQGRVEDVVHGAFEAESTALAVDTQGTGGEFVGLLDGQGLALSGKGEEEGAEIDQGGDLHFDVWCFDLYGFAKRVKCLITGFVEVWLVVLFLGWHWKVTLES